MDITGRTVLITGGASGLGRATAMRLLGEGAHVVLLDLPTTDGGAVAAELGEKAAFAPADVRDPEEVQAAVDVARDRFGGVHVAVNCAGVPWPGRIVTREGEPLDLGLFTQVVEVNLIGTFNVMRLAAAAMVANEPDDNGDRGVIVNTASIAAFDGQIGQAAYAASKGGVVALTLPAARDLASHAIRVNTIAPGLMDTPMLAMLPEDQREALYRDVPHPRRLGSSDEFAQLVAHLVANPYLNGEVVRLDGALRMAAR